MPFALAGIVSEAPVVGPCLVGFFFKKEHFYCNFFF